MSEPLALQAALADEARAWVDRLLADLADADRAVSGGWPGTITEARRLVLGWLAHRPRGTAFNGDDVDRLARGVYGAARREWRRRANAAQSDLEPLD